MKWFPGSINDAVTTSKQRKAIFVVFVEGKDEPSIQVAQAIESSEISSRLERDDFVAIRLESDSESHRLFAQIYRSVPVPSLFFIGTNGVPLEVISGSITASDLSKKIDSILEKIGKTVESSSANLIDAEKNIVPSTHIPEASSSNDTVLGVIPTVEKPGSSTAETTTKDLTAEEKLERAKQLIELQRQQKVADEWEKDKQREIERRQLGKDLVTAKKKLHDAGMELAYEERKREKAADAAARERVRQQIAQDKLERKQKEEVLQRKQASNQQQQQNQQERTQSPAENSGTIARIQFRLPLGNAHMGKFEAASTLGSLRSYVANNIELPFKQFAMSMSFPRRDLTVEDDAKTLAELELVPTAVILILPVKSSNSTKAVASADDVGFLSRFIWALFAPIVSVYNFVMGYFSGAPATPPEQRRSDASENVGRFGSSVGQPSGLMNRNLFGGPATTIRSRGNIHRLHSGGDDNDENNTWNGNSTQQM